ncbi:MAG: tail fiber domain-containing protein [Balneola sp.]|nr:MAG: tail fiber domain-containing protein [Balneola sp.]
MKRLIFVSLFLFISATEILAQTAPTLNIQGVLRDDQNMAVSDGTYQLTFKLYEDQTGGAEIWEEDQSLTITNGVYSALLGDATDLSGIGFNSQYYLGIAVDGGLELGPRIPLSLSPYSMAVVGSENVFPSTGAVGIGTTSPDSEAKLQIEGGDLVISNGEFHLSASNIKLDDNWISGDGDDEGIFVNANGEVGIGTTNIEEDFQVNGMSLFEGATRFDKPSIQSGGNTFDYDIWIQGGADTLGGDSRNLAILGDETTDQLHLNYAGEYKGGVEIGGKTHAVDGFIATRVPTHNSGSRLGIGSHGGEGGNDNVQPGYKFVDDNDTGLFSHSDGVINFFNNGYETIWIDRFGIKCGQGLGSCGLENQFSDRRIKTDIRPYSSFEALENILKLSPKTYRFRFLDAAPVSHGLIAQEVEKVLPHAVTDSGKNKTLSDGTVIENVKELDFDAITLELVLAIKQLNEKVDALAKENEELKSQLANIKEKETSSPENKTDR